MAASISIPVILEAQIIQLEVPAELKRAGGGGGNAGGGGGGSGGGFTRLP